ncbi:MAG TPA: alpha/beta hydrolase [Bdellovibrionota bacterium]|nr:alpha/beta hydrolase [Bdellovibrionota bacterium]
MKPRLICFHGSPGVPDEFEPLRTNLAGKVEVLSPVRAGYPGYSGPVGTRPRDVVLGYSFGCVEAIREAVSQKEIRELILVAPYLFPKPVGGLKRLLVGAPYLGEWLCKKAGSAQIARMLIDSSFPCEVPDAYRRAGEEMRHPGSLRRSVLEKVIDETEIAALFEAVVESKIPVAVVWGEQDKTIRETDQLGRLRRVLFSANKAAGKSDSNEANGPENFLEKSIENAGHAIPWTHARELAAFIFENTLGEKT